ncbi:thioredoxin domain-containing protein [bacterium]|nr:thioredoxin domain-containing protein [bacterium]
MIKHKNHLLGEKSPYLLQHADNPVDWYPWCEEAFNKASEEDKPVFLSIGYSTCHWCHVMAHESFENEQVAELMNNTFVSIKVDREERPDVDSVYMKACQVLTGSGGWPLTIIMTPEKIPFFAGTYIPKSTRFGRIGMLELIPRINDLWNNQRDTIINSAEEVNRLLQRSTAFGNEQNLNEDIIEIAYTRLKNGFDEQHGGFGQAPKFPSPHNIMFLLRYWQHKGNSKALEMVEKTLTSISLGGIHDHLGHGFHRYSTDDTWKVPHFEKMLYDQAMLIIAYTEAYQATGNSLFKETAIETIEYVIRNMMAAKGGFYSAEDADSDGEEGKFYFWSSQEINDLLTNEEAKIAAYIFNIEEDGNYNEEATGKKTGKNILYFKKTLKEYARELGMDVVMLEEKYNKICEKLYKERVKRIPLLKDDKILADWNGLMIAALAKAGAVFENKRYEETAIKAVDFMINKMLDNQNKLKHWYKDEKVSINDFLSDYSYVIWGLLELYESTFDTVYIEKALVLNEILLEYFWDDDNGGFYETPEYGEEILFRQKELYDGALPSGNSIAFYNLLRLSRLTGRHEYEDKADKLIRTFSSMISRTPTGFLFLLGTFILTMGQTYEIVITGELESEHTKKVLRFLRGSFLPNAVVVFKNVNTGEKSEEKVAKDKGSIEFWAPYTKDLKLLEDKTTVYICENNKCKFPITNLSELAEVLDLKGV